MLAEPVHDVDAVTFRAPIDRLLLRQLPVEGSPEVGVPVSLAFDRLL